MKLVQKLPIGLGIVCLMLSSCSKEDIQSPVPKVESENTYSNFKLEAAAPSISSTKGNTGINLLPANWTRNNVGYSNDAVKYPTGVSNIKQLWGDPAKPFVQGLSIIPWAPNINSFVTVTTRGTTSNFNKSSVKTKIMNLTPGKKYALTAYVSSTLPKGVSGTGEAYYAKTCLLSVRTAATVQETVVDLTNYKFCWVQKVFTFTATSSQMDFRLVLHRQIPVSIPMHIF